jgi:5S rRNA maturation endonuclease (ribonuclease M5)
MANEVMMLRTSMRGPIVLVEGKTDTRLYRKFFVPQHVKLVSCDGKPLLYAAMTTIRKHNTAGVIGLCDADYDRIIGVRKLADIFYADMHDAETMICYSNAFSRVFEELMDHESGSSDFQRPRDSLFDMACTIGEIRLWSLQNNASLKFSGIDPGEYLSSAGELDVEGYITALLENTESTHVDASDLVQVAAARRNNQAGIEIASGHDFCALLAAYVSQSRSEGCECSQDTVESMLRLGFDAECFAKTDLARVLLLWEEKTGLELMINEACPC